MTIVPTCNSNRTQNVTRLARDGPAPFEKIRFTLIEHDHFLAQRNECGGERFELRRESVVLRFQICSLGRICAGRLSLIFESGALLDCGLHRVAKGLAQCVGDIAQVLRFVGELVNLANAGHFGVERACFSDETAGSWSGCLRLGRCGSDLRGWLVFGLLVGGGDAENFGDRASQRVDASLQAFARRVIAILDEGEELSDGVEDRGVYFDLALEVVALILERGSGAGRCGGELLIYGIKLRLEIGEMGTGLGFELGEVLALRGALRWLAVVIGGGLLALRVYEWHGGSGGIKGQTNGLLGESAGVSLVYRVAREAGGLHFRGGVAIPGDDGAEVMNDGVAADGGLVVGSYQGGGGEAQAQNQGCEDDACRGGQLANQVWLVELSSSWHRSRIRR